MQTTLTILGTGACIPQPGDDTASYLVNGEILIDTGWHVTETLRRAGKTPADIKALFFTHMHHDHMMALAAFLYERYASGNSGELTIFGPHTLPEAVENADRYLQKQVYWPDISGAKIQVLSGSEEFEFGRVHVCTMPSVHAVQGLCYCMMDTVTGRKLGFPGDGEPLPEHPAFFKDCDVLTHEFSLGLSKETGHPTRHSSIWDAARIAQEAKAAMLCPVHGPAVIKNECAEELKTIYAGNVHWPKPNETFVFPAK